MKKSLVIVSICLILLMTLSFVSAGWFTGRAVKVIDGSVRKYITEKRPFTFKFDDGEEEYTLEFLGFTGNNLEIATFKIEEETISVSLYERNIFSNYPVGVAVLKIISGRWVKIQVMEYKTLDELEKERQLSESKSITYIDPNECLLARDIKSSDGRSSKLKCNSEQVLMSITSIWCPTGYYGKPMGGIHMLEAGSKSPDLLTNQISFTCEGPDGGQNSVAPISVMGYCCSVKTITIN